MTSGSAPGSATIDAVDGEDWDRRLDRVGRRFMLPLLLAATLLAYLAMRTGFGTPARFYYGLIAVGGAAVWVAAVDLRTIGGPEAARTIGFAGHWALAAVLVGVNPWFGLFAFTGYMLADELPPRWREAGFVLNAAVVAGSQVGGYPFVDTSAWPIYLLVLAVNVTILFALVGITRRVLQQNTERGQMIADLHETNERLEAALAENAGLHAQLVEQAREAGVQDERQRLAGEIHDTLAQDLIGIVTQLEAAQQARHLSEEWQRHVDQARALARDGLVEARRSVRALRPEQLEHAGLAEAVDELARSWAQTANVPVRVEATGAVRPLAVDVEAALFRVAQEALTNVGKHAHASKVWLTLTYLDDIVLLDVRDDGLGWSGDPRAGSYGITGMRSRLAQLGGRLEVETAPGEGTALSASVPVAGTLA
jgi:signal transduction histidine kinase